MTGYSRYARLLPYGQRQSRSLLVIAALTAGVSVIATLHPWPMKILVDYGLRHEAAPNWLRSLLQSVHISSNPTALIFAAAAGSLCLFALNSALDAALNWAWTICGRRMVNDLTVDVFARLQRRSLLSHNRSSIGDSLSRLTADTWCVQELTAGLLIAPARNLLNLTLLGIAGWSLSPQITILSLMLAPMLGASSLFFGRKLKKRARRTREAQSQLLSFVQQTLAAIPVVQAFGREDFNRRRFEDLAGEATVLSQRRALMDSSFGMVNGLITTIGVAIVLYFGGQRVMAGSLSVGGLLVFLTYMRNLQAASESLLNTYGTLKPIEASIDRVLEILETKDALPEPAGAPPLPGIEQQAGRRVSLENVTFGYDPANPVLHGISIEAGPGKTVALVGETGAGKSTLSSLIPRFFDPQAGRVTIDGIDIRDLQLASVRQQVSLVLQEPFILPLSIAENISYGRTEASRHEIVEAATAANAHEFIIELPQGYDTVVGERGATLSGGQKQRLSIARALLKNAPILILDEPTSALDARTESLLVEALQRLMAGRTTFIIAHRLSTIRHADEIVVLHHGRIAERGTHEQLLAEGRLYRECYRMQAPELVRGAIA